MFSLGLINMAKPETNPLMTLTDVAEYLKIAERTVLRLVHKGTLPGTKVGNQWRFFKSIIDEWLLANMGNSHQIVPETDEGCSLSGLFNSGYVLLNLKPGRKKEIFRQLINPLLEENYINTPSLLIQKLLYRENISSTGIGHGVAFPHIRNPRENPAGVPPVIAGVCRAGADFDALDGKPVKLFFLLCSNQESLHLFPVIAGVCRAGADFDALDGKPVKLFFLLCSNQESLHLFIMSRLGHLLMDESFRNDLIRSLTAEEFVRLISLKENLKQE
jgi:PTS system nitrogen regulatory IIA component